MNNNNESTIKDSISGRRTNRSGSGGSSGRRGRRGRMRRGRPRGTPVAMPRWGPCYRLQGCSIIIIMLFNIINIQII